MSSTRKAKDDSKFHQARYASSPEFERGLLANLVAKRCALIDAAADRELIWFLQHLSHQAGGLAAVVKDVIAQFPDRIQTEEMAAMKLKSGAICNEAQVRKLRGRFNESESFILRGEKSDWLSGGYLSAEALLTDADRNRSQCEIEDDKRRAQNHPISYPANDFFKACSDAAASGLEKFLQEICLNPESSLDSGPWYYPRLIETLREYKASFVLQKSAGVVVTALGAKVCDTLDYTAYSRGLTLMQGEARTGKSYAARAWCEQRPGVARFVEVPPSNDETSFFRALARGLGLGNFLNYKAGEIRDRVESVLLSGDILLVLDEAQRLWPQRNLRYGFPSRIVWVMTMANAGVPIAMVSTPQFIQTQKAVEKTGWDSAQLTGRISHFESLPGSLSADDLMAVAKAVLPEAGAQVLRVLAIYAQTSARNLAAIDSISKRARYIAMRAGREAATTDDVRKAMQESVIPADTKLHLALASGKKAKAESITPMPAPGMAQDRPQDDSDGTEAATPAGRRRADLDALGAPARARADVDFEAHLIGA
ncbi:MAG: ATP-binding protein [Verrucomicrobiota bacterium]|jgi:hypothetical protein